MKMAVSFLIQLLIFKKGKCSTEWRVVQVFLLIGNDSSKSSLHLCKKEMASETPLRILRRWRYGIVWKWLYDEQRFTEDGGWSQIVEPHGWMCRVQISAPTLKACTGVASMTEAARQIQPEKRLVSLWWPLEDKVALTEQCCSFMQSLKMLIKLGDRWRSACSSNEHVPGKLTDWFLSEKRRFEATGRGNEAIFVALWSISTVSLLLLLQGGDSESITDFWICHLLAIPTLSLSRFVWASLSI